MGDQAWPRRRRALGGSLLAIALIGGSGACSDDDGDDAAPRGELVGTGDTYEATIRRTSGGGPHITGDPMADAAFGQGWAGGEGRTRRLAHQGGEIRGGGGRGGG